MYLLDHVSDCKYLDFKVGSNDEHFALCTCSSVNYWKSYKPLVYLSLCDFCKFYISNRQLTIFF